MADDRRQTGSFITEIDMNKKFLCIFLVVLLSSIMLWAQAQSRRTYIYDSAGQLVGVIDEEGNRLSYTYDAAGNMISVERLTARGDVDIFFLEPNRGKAAVPPQKGTPVTIHGIGFSDEPDENEVTFNGVAAVVDSSTNTMIKTTVPEGATTGRVRVTSPLGTATSRNDFIVITGIVVTVSPARVDVAVRQGQQFTAILTEGGRVIPSNVTWSVNPTVGTITQNGLYTAPASIPRPPTVTVTATSQEEMTSSANATVTIVQGIGPIFTRGLSYGVDQSGRPINWSPIFTSGISYRVDRSTQPVVWSAIFTKGISYTSIVVTGLNPTRVSRGATAVPFTVTGNNFNGATTLDFLLPDGNIDTDITVADLTVSVDGTQITASISVADEAEVGARTVVVRTPVGPSTTMATENNQLVIE